MLISVAARTIPAPRDLSEAGGRIVRISIGAKIFSISLVLLALMAGAAAVSALTVDRITAELDLLTHNYLPLAERVASAEAYGFEQEIHFERLRLLYDQAPRDEAAIEAALAQFQQHGASLDAELAAAAALAAARENVLDAGAARVLGGIDVRLEMIAREHQDFEDHARALLGYAARGDHAVRDELARLIDVEEVEYREAVDALRRDVETFSRDVALRAESHERELRVLTFVLTGAAAVLGLLIAAVVTIGLVRPVRRLLAGMRDIQAGNLEARVAVSTRDEIGALAGGFNEMAGELRVKERIKDMFGHYVDPRIVQDLIDKPSLTEPGGERRVMTVFFSDIAGFTRIGERLTPGGLVGLINAYLTEMSEPIRVENGVVDKYIGDAIMAYWGPPFVAADEQAARACRAALDSLDRLAAFGRRVPEIVGLRQDAPEIDIRIGIATGPMVVGNVGSDVLKNYTLMGDTVNLGSRLEGACKAYGLRILIAEETRNMAGGAIEAREIDSLAVKGKNEPVRIFEPMALGGQLDDANSRLKEHFEIGLAAYRAQDWDGAEAAFRACRGAVPEDAPSGVFMERVKHLRAQPPGADWDGVWRLTVK